MRQALPIAAVFLLAVTFTTGAQSPAPGVKSPKDLLREVAQFTDGDWEAVERGEPVARVLDTDTREVAVAGAVRIAGPQTALVERFQDITNLKGSSLVLAVERFSQVPQPEDLKAVTFEDRSLDLRACRAGDCQVRLSADDIARFHREVQWSGRDWREQSAAVWRDVLAGHARAYMTNGRRGLPVFVNKAEPLAVASEVSDIVRDFGFVSDYAPDVHRYLRELGAALPPGARDTLYWTKEDFGVRPIVRISHQMVYGPRGPQPVSVIVTNQVYADHYLDAALGLTLAVGLPGAADRGFYMIAVNRARTRSLGGLLRRVVRSTVQKRSRDALRQVLAGAKRSVESGSPKAGSYPPVN